MSTFGDDLIQSLNEALAHARGDGPAIVHAPVIPREVRRKVNLTQAQMAPLMGMSLSGYRKWEQGTRRVSGPAATLLRVIEREPEAVLRAITATVRPIDHDRRLQIAAFRPRSVSSAPTSNPTTTTPIAGHRQGPRSVDD